MPLTISVNDVPGHGLKALGTVPAYTNYKPGASLYTTFSAGSVIGVVWSWVYGVNAAGAKDGTIWFQLYENNDVSKRVFFVKYDQNTMTLTDALQVSQAQIEQAARDRLQKDIEAAGGWIPYYAGKYGLWIALAASAAIVIPSLRKK